MIRQEILKELLPFTAEELEFFRCDGRIDNLVMRNNRLFSVPGAGRCVELAGSGPGEPVAAEEK